MNTEAPKPVEEEAKKSGGLKTVLIGSAGAVALGAVAAGAAYLVAPGAAPCAAVSAAEHKPSAKPKELAEPVFIVLEPLVVTLGPGAKSRYLKISLSLETTKDNEKSLANMTPRIRDTLNAYLRAVEEEDLIRPSSMSRLRAQMLRRLELVAPSAEINDLLITDFVLT